MIYDPNEFPKKLPQDFDYSKEETEFKNNNLALRNHLSKNRKNKTFLSYFTSVR